MRSVTTLRVALARAGALAFPVGLLLAAAPRVASAQGRVQPAPTPRPAAQQVVVRSGPSSTGSGADSLVQCVPVNAPRKHVAAAKPHRAHRRPRPVATKVAKPAPRPVAVAPATPKPTRPIVHRVRRVRHVTPATAAPARTALPSLVMCRPIHPVPASQMGPLPETLVPIPQVASAAPPPAPAALPVAPASPPPFVTASAPGPGYLPLAIIPAVFFPFIHGSHRTHADTPVDTTTPPLTTPPPPPGPPLTTPEPSSLAMLATGLLALAGARGVRRRRHATD